MYGNCLGIKPQSGAHPQFFTSCITWKRCTPGQVRLHKLSASLVSCRKLEWTHQYRQQGRTVGGLDVILACTDTSLQPQCSDQAAWPYSVLLWNRCPQLWWGLGMICSCTWGAGWSSTTGLAITEKTSWRFISPQSDCNSYMVGNLCQCWDFSGCICKYIIIYSI